MGGFYVGECPLISPFLKNNGPLHNKLVQLTCHTGIKSNQGVIMTPGMSFPHNFLFNIKEKDIT
jgi:hypothetical protein